VSETECRAALKAQTALPLLALLSGFYPVALQPVCS
jgi:hypothetical protein